ncbi:MAG: hypothetical protein QM776_09195 [Rhodocyclaceae bacterium]
MNSKYFFCAALALPAMLLSCFWAITTAYPDNGYSLQATLLQSGIPQALISVGLLVIWACVLRRRGDMLMLFVLSPALCSLIFSTMYSSGNEEYFLLGLIYLLLDSLYVCVVTGIYLCLCRMGAVIDNVKAG